MASKPKHENMPASRDLVPIGNGYELPASVIEVIASTPSLTELEAEDRMVPHFFFNMKWQDPQTQEWIPPDVFFHSLREDTKPQITATPLFLRKTRKYRLYDEKEGSSTLCFSLDRKIGHWQEPQQTLECATCPYAVWKDGKPAPCKVLYNVVGLDVETGEPFILTAKSTSVRPVKRFLNRYFVRKLNGSDLPLFVYRTKIGLVRPVGTYAVLAFQVMGRNSEEEIRAAAALCTELWESRRVDLTTEQPEVVEVVEGEAEAPPPDDEVPF